MKLEPEGKKRLDTMRKTLAAGLPLAGLLAASVAVGAAAQGCGRCVPGVIAPSALPPPEEWRVRGRTVAQPSPENQVPAEPSAEPVKPETTVFPADEQAEE